MPMKYSCFISYAHGQGKYVGPLIHALHEEISSQLEMHCDEEVFLDEDRLLPGYEYNEQLAQAICESACMVVAYTPIYRNRDYCRREFEAMCLLEKKRKKILGNVAKGHRFFIPVVLTGGIACLPSHLKGTTHSCDISDFSLRGTALRRCNGFAQKIKPVCDGIVKIRQLLMGCQATWDAKMNCKSFKMPCTGGGPVWTTDAIPSFPGRVGTP